MWCVVQFNEDDRVAIIRRSWAKFPLTPDDDSQISCLYPITNINTAKLKSLLLKQEKLEEAAGIEVKEYESRLLKDNIDNLNNAMLFLKRSTYRSDIENSTDSEALGRGKRQKRKKELSSSEDEEMSDKEVPEKRSKLENDHDNDETQFDVSSLKWGSSSTAQPPKPAFRPPSPVAKVDSINLNNLLAQDSPPSTQVNSFVCSTQKNSQPKRSGNSQKLKKQSEIKERIKEIKEKEKANKLCQKSAVSREEVSMKPNNQTSTNTKRSHASKQTLNRLYPKPHTVQNLSKLSAQNANASKSQQQRNARNTTASSSTIQKKSGENNVRSSQTSNRNTTGFTMQEKTSENNVISKSAKSTLSGGYAFSDPRRPPLAAIQNNNSNVSLIELNVKLNRIEGKLNNVQSAMNKVGIRVVKISSTLECANTSLDSLEKKMTDLVIQEMDRQTDEISGRLPLKNLLDLDHFEEDLIAETTFRSACKKRLAFKNSSSIKASTNNILRALFSDELALQFSWVGHKGKRNFSDYSSTLELLREVVRLEDPQATDGMIDSVAKIWLTKAPERLKSSAKKSGRTELLANDEIDGHGSIADNEIDGHGSTADNEIDGHGSIVNDGINGHNVVDNDIDGHGSDAAEFRDSREEDESLYNPDDNYQNSQLSDENETNFSENDGENDEDPDEFWSVLPNK